MIAIESKLLLDHPGIMMYRRDVVGGRWSLVSVILEEVRKNISPSSDVEFANSVEAN